MACFRQSSWLLWLVVVGGVAASLVAWRFSVASEDRAIGARLASRAVEHSSAIEQQLSTDVAAVESIAAVFETSLSVSRSDFRAVTSHLLARHPSLRAIGWNPRVLGSERDEFEAAARTSGIRDYRITEAAASGAMVPASARLDHYVVRYIEPYADNEEALGYDIGSEPRRRAAIESAAASGEPRMTAAIALVQDEEREPGFLAFWPLVRPGAGRAPERIYGGIVGVFQVRKLVETALGRFDVEDMELRIEDATPGAEGELLYATPAEDAPASTEARFAKVTTFEHWGRTWKLHFTPGAGAVAALRSGYPGLTLAVGLFGTALFGASLLELSRRNRRAEERLRLEVELQRTQRLEGLGVLAGGIAHDFNNILTGILGSADLALQDLPADAPCRGDLEEIQRASTRAAELTQQMLVYAGKARTTPEPIDVTRLVDETANLLESSLSRKATLERELDWELPPVQGDQTRLRQIVMNLITNASDALGEEPGVITLRTGMRHFAGEALSHEYGESGAAGPRIFLSVSDTGCGMDEATCNRIFDPFFSTKFPGRGLGLAAVLGIVRSHRGGVNVDSTPGRGTEMTIVLPPADVHASAATEAPPSVARVKGRGTVLVVDDEEPIRRLTSRILSQAGFQVRTASDGEEGVRVFHRHSSEIVAVVLDVTMPHMSGPEALREMRRLRADLPVLFISGWDRESSLQGLEGVDRPDGFLHKPFSSKGLFEALSRALPEPDDAKPMERIPPRST